MNRSLRPTLERLRVSSPCKADWDAMTGNSEVRFCEHCSKHVHDLSAMTRREAEQLVAESNGRLCIRYRRSSDNRVITKDTPPMLHAIRRTSTRASRLAAGAFTAALSVTTVTAPAAAQTLPTSAGVVAIDERNSPAQMRGGTASLVGTVLDPNRAVIPNARVTLTQANMGIMRVQTTVTNEDGAYRFQSIGDGTYTIEVEATGFLQKQILNIHVSEGEPLQLDVPLELNIEVVTMGIMVAISPVQNWIYHNDKRTDYEETTNDDERALDFLTAAVSDEDAELAQMLAAGMYVDATNRYVETTLMLAAYDKKAVERLLNAGASVNATSRFGVTPLMYAMLNDDAEIAQLLIARGARVNHHDVDGRTALMFAAFDGRLETIRVLLEAGADVCARDNEGKSILRYAIEGNQEEAAALLRAAGAVE